MNSTIFRDQGHELIVVALILLTVSSVVVLAEEPEELALRQLDIFLEALSEESEFIEKGYDAAVEMDAQVIVDEGYSQDGLTAWHEWNASLLLEEDSITAAPRLMGRAISRFQAYYEQPDDYPIMLQLGHLDLRRALEDSAPDHLLPDSNKSVADLAALDLLRPHTEAEKVGVEQGREWALALRTRRISQHEVDELRAEQLVTYSEQPDFAIEYQVGLALAAHDDVLERTIPMSVVDQLTFIPNRAADALTNGLQPLLGEEELPARVQQLERFAEAAVDTEQPIHLALERLQQEMYVAARERAHQAMIEEAERQKRLQMTRNTIEYTDTLLSIGKGMDELTDAQRRRNFQLLEGQWVRWTGEIVDVRGRGHTVRVIMRCSPTTLISDTSFSIDRETGLSLLKGQRVTVEGQLANHSNIGGYTLSNVEIVE